jgi:ankyrin repeat protein
LRFLLEHKADVDVKTISRNTTLYRAAENRHEAVLKHMVDVDAKDNDERTVLHWAAENGH